MKRILKILFIFIVAIATVPIRGQVTSFNTRSGAVTLNSSDVSSALGYIPRNRDITDIQIPCCGTINGPISTALAATDCSQYCVIRLPAGPVHIDSPVTIPAGVRIYCNGTSITPTASMTEMFIISGGQSGIENCQIDNKNSYATYGIVITKPTNNLPIDIDQNYIGGFTQGIYATNGADVVHISRNMFGSTGIAIDASGKNLNWTIGPSNYILGSNGILMNNASGGDEGFEIFDNTILPSSEAGSNSYCLAVNGGLETTFERNICDQIVSGNGINLNGNLGTINATKIVHNWIGRNYLNENAMIGIYSYETNNTIIENNTIVGFTVAGIYASGTSSAYGNGLIIRGNNSYIGDPVGNDLFIDFQNAALISDNFFNGTSNNITTTSGAVSGVAINNRFTLAVPIIGALRFGPQNGEHQGPTYTVSQLNTNIPCTAALESVRGPEVSDASAPTFLTTLVGSGAVRSPSMCIGGHWVSG